MKRSARSLRWLPIILALATLTALLLVACTQDLPEDTTPAATDPITGEPTEAPDTDGDTEAPTDEVTTEETTTEEVTTDDPSTRENKPTDPAHVTFFISVRPKLTSIFSGANQCKFEIVMDETYGSVLKLTTTACASDPFVSFNYNTYMKGVKLESVNADEY